jgi:hypothetical protein
MLCGGEDKRTKEGSGNFLEGLCSIPLTLIILAVIGNQK